MSGGAGANWRSPEPYAGFLVSDRRVFAWEWLRRSPLYRDLWKKRDRIPGEALESLGLLGWIDPALPASEARPIWSIGRDPCVLKGRPAREDSPADDLFDVRDVAPFVFDGKASPTDADDLAPGMETQIRFTALQQRNPPILVGKISKISAHSFEDERSGIRYFKIELVVPPSELAKLRRAREDGGLRAGLPVDIMIPVRKRTALSHLIERSLRRSGSRGAKIRRRRSAGNWQDKSLTRQWTGFIL